MRLLRRRPAYPLLLPAMLWLGIFFFIPMAFMAYKSLQVVLVDLTYHQHFSFASKWANYTYNISQY